MPKPISPSLELPLRQAADVLNRDTMDLRRLIDSGHVQARTVDGIIMVDVSHLNGIRLRQMAGSADGRWAGRGSQVMGGHHHG